MLLLDKRTNRTLISHRFLYCYSGERIAKLLFKKNKTNKTNNNNT